MPHCVPISECLDIAVKHGQELYRIQFLAVKRHFHVKIISTDGYRLTCFYLLSETDEYISKMRIGHFVFAKRMTIYTPCSLSVPILDTTPLATAAKGR